MFVTNIRHTGIVVKDLNFILDFFVKILGFKIQIKALEKGIFIEEILNLKKVKVTTAKLKAPNGGMLEFLKFHNFNEKTKVLKKIYSKGITHISLTVKNIEKLKKILIKKKIYILNKPKISPDKKVKVMFCRFSENFYIEFVEEIIKN